MMAQMRFIIIPAFNMSVVFIVLWPNTIALGAVETGRANA